MGDASGHHLATRAGQGGEPPPDDHRREISRPTAAGRAPRSSRQTRWLPPRWVVATVGYRILMFSGHSSPSHTSLPPFLDPMNSFPWSLFADSSPFERYDENKFGRLLDRVFRPPQQLLDQGKGTSVFLVSWAFR